VLDASLGVGPSWPSWPSSRERTGRRRSSDTDPPPLHTRPGSLHCSPTIHHANPMCRPPHVPPSYSPSPFQPVRGSCPLRGVHLGRRQQDVLPQGQCRRLLAPTEPGLWPEAPRERTAPFFVVVFLGTLLVSHLALLSHRRLALPLSYFRAPMPARRVLLSRTRLN